MIWDQLTRLAFRVFIVEVLVVNILVLGVLWKAFKDI
jgi:hypothetical protein